MSQRQVPYALPVSPRNHPHGTAPISFQIHWSEFNDTLLRGDVLNPILYFPNYQPTTYSSPFSLKISLVNDLGREIRMPGVLMPDRFLVHPEQCPCQLNFRLALSPSECYEGDAVPVGSNRAEKKKQDIAVCRFRFSLWDVPFTESYCEAESPPFALVTRASRIKEYGNFRVLLTDLIPSVTLARQPLRLDLRGYFPPRGNYQVVLDQGGNEILLPARWLCNERLEVVVPSPSVMPGLIRVAVITSKGHRFETREELTIFSRDSEPGTQVPMPPEQKVVQRDPFEDVLEKLLLGVHHGSQQHPFEARMIPPGVIQQQDPFCGFSLLIWAVYSQQPLQVVDSLWCAGAEINHQDFHGRTALHWAVSLQEEQIVEYLINCGADCQKLDHGGNTPLHYAAATGRVRTVALLLSRGLRADAVNYEGETSTHLAAAGGYEDVLQMLLEQSQCEVNIRTRRRGDTELHYAAEEGNSRAYQILMRLGAQPFQMNLLGQTPEKMLEDRQREALMRNTYVLKPPMYSPLPVKNGPNSLMSNHPQIGNSANGQHQFGGQANSPSVVGGPSSMTLAPRSPTNVSASPISPHPHSHPVNSPLNPGLWRHEDFLTMDTLGTGTFARVCLVQHKPTRNYYAMKICKKKSIVRLKQVKHIHSEKTVLKTIDHPFIVKLFATFKDEANLYLLFEYLPGGEIFGQLRRFQKFSNEWARFYAAEITLAFGHLHLHKIVYRDLKPENILLDASGHIKLVDFGFAKYLDDNVRTLTLCGTPEYLAPEMIASSGHGKEVDWWSLGILIYEMLAGYTPFMDDNPFVVYQKILKGQIKFPSSGFSPQARDIVSRLLTNDSPKRLGSAGVDEVKSQPWFEGLQWDLVFKKQLQAPFSPQLSHPGDISYFRDDSDINSSPIDQSDGEDDDIGMDSGFDHFIDF